MKKELLFSVTKKDFVIEPFKGSGKGGQHRNKTMSCIRMTHPDSGTTVIATEYRDQRKNRKLAFRRMVAVMERKLFPCKDCKKLTSIYDEEENHIVNEYYMVHDKIWKKAHKESESTRGILCFACLEKRLGRKLATHDFTDAPVNSEHIERFKIS